jgi:hypothetical protein
MILELVFDNSGDSIQFDVVHNHELIEFFVNHCDNTNNNTFKDAGLANIVGPLLRQRHAAVSSTNEVMEHLLGYKFDESLNLEDYLDQRLLNKQHADWVRSQNSVLNIDNLRFSENTNTSRLGEILHSKYPDEIRDIKLAQLMQTLGRIFPYEEVNMTIHRLENAFNSIEYSSENKWDVFTNPFIGTMYSANDITNLSFAYTYVGRQTYDKFCSYDDTLEFDDHYNFEQLECSFHVSLSKPQTIPFSEEFIKWASSHGIPMVAGNIPIANIPNLSHKLFDYRIMLLRNSTAGNTANLRIK